MAAQFTVEDGTGLAAANSYVTLAEADQYLENSGRKGGGWSHAGGEKQEALVKAFLYMFSRWTDRWRGITANEDQAGDWPRREVFKRSGHAFQSNEIPVAVKNAQIEYALIEANEPGSLFPNPEYDETNRAVTGKTDKIGPITESRQYSGRISPTTFRKFPLADNMLKNLVLGAATTELLRL